MLRKRQWINDSPKLGYYENCSFSTVYDNAGRNWFNVISYMCKGPLVTKCSKCRSIGMYVSQRCTYYSTSHRWWQMFPWSLQYYKIRCKWSILHFYMLLSEPVISIFWIWYGTTKALYCYYYFGFIWFINVNQIETEALHALIFKDVSVDDSFFLCIFCITWNLKLLQIVTYCKLRFWTPFILETVF